MSIVDSSVSIETSAAAKLIAFDAEITADYGDTQLSFVLHTQVDKDGNVVFSVLEPQSIAGITGTVSQSGGKLTFDDKAVAFHLLAEGQLSPICGPWIMVKALRGGYLSSCCAEEDLFHLSVDDSYEAESMGVEVWFDENGCIAYAEVYWQGRMLLSMKVENFVYV